MTGCSSSCYFREVPLESPRTLENGMEQTAYRVGSHDIVIYKGDPRGGDDLLVHSVSDRTGVLMWPGSTVVAHALLVFGHAGALVGRSVLELGSGVGFCSVVASLFSGEVVVTDQSSEMRDIAGANLRANRHLLWYSSDPSVRSRCKTQVLGLAWPGEGCVGEPFDESGARQFNLVIASDVLYVDEPRFGGLSAADLVSFFTVVRRKLAIGGLALVAYANRERGADIIKECAGQCGLHCIELPLRGFMPAEVLHAGGAYPLKSVLMFGFVSEASAAVGGDRSGTASFCHVAKALISEPSAPLA